MQEIARSKCRNVLQLVDSDEDRDMHILVTQFMPGHSLLDYILK